MSKTADTIIDLIDTALAENEDAMAHLVPTTAEDQDRLHGLHDDDDDDDDDEVNE